MWLLKARRTDTIVSFLMAPQDLDVSRNVAPILGLIRPLRLSQYFNIDADETEQCKSMVMVACFDYFFFWENYTTELNRILFLSFFLLFSFFFGSTAQWDCANVFTRQYNGTVSRACPKNSFGEAACFDCLPWANVTDIEYGSENVSESAGELKRSFDSGCDLIPMMSRVISSHIQ